MRGPEDRNGDDQESVICFLVNKTLSLSSFYLHQYQDTRPYSDPSIPLRCEFEFFFFCDFGDHPHRGDLSLGYRMYLFSALHPQASA